MAAIYLTSEHEYKKNIGDRERKCLEYPWEESDFSKNDDTLPNASKAYKRKEDHIL